MSDIIQVGSVAGLLDAAHTLVDELQAAVLTRDTDDDLVDAVRSVERLRRRLDSVDYTLINETERREVPSAHGARTTGRWLQGLLRLDPWTANQRVAAAQAAGPRISHLGELLGPVFTHVAAGQASGVVSQRQALLIERVVDTLPDAAQAEHGDQIERDLVGYAADFDPARLGVLAARIVAHVHPDGDRPTEDAIQRRRYLHVAPRSDGGSRVEGELDREATERLLTFFDAAAAPHPAVDGDKDTRTVGQRQHDAFCTLLETAVRVGDVPSNNGVSATIVVTMTTEQYQSGEGLARTGHGAYVPVADALHWSGGDTHVLAVAMNSMRKITHYSHTHRIFTEHQRRVIAVRDRGCTFPGCDQPPGHCQTDHVTRHEHGGPTSIDNGQLLCRYHHREHDKLGWQPTMINGQPHWIPPARIDPTQRPRRNSRHDTVPAA